MTPPIHFVSLASLRAAHSQLLSLHRRFGSTPNLLSQAIQFIEQGRATGALLDNDSERAVAQSLLDYWSAIVYRSGGEPPESALAEFDWNLAPDLPDELCPYVGLDAFSEGKQGVFFGRERLLEASLRLLARDRLLAVVGPSGSGKSSLVLAGLVPRLKEGALAGSEDWHYAPRMVPGSAPLANLARVLYSPQRAPTLSADQWTEQQAGALAREPQRLVQLLDQEDAPTLLVVDQFEEAFTLCTDDAARKAFVACLMALLQARGRRHSLVLTMRTDFESLVSRMPDLQAQFERHLFRVTPLNAAELRASIVRPAEQIGLKFEQGLVDRLLEDMLGEPAALPLLQFTLLKLWERREHNYITWDTYRRLGGGRLALANSADAFFDSLIPEEQLTARRILLRLVRAGEGLEITSNRVRLNLLYQTGEAEDRVSRVLDKLISARLLRLTQGDVASDAQIEIAHEALVRNWPRLVSWLEEEREIIRQRQRLSDAAHHWAILGRDDGALLPATLLHEATRFVNRSDVGLSTLEMEFLEASRRSMVAEQEREVSRQMELHKAHVEAQHQARRARRLRAVAITLSLLLAVPMMLVMMELWQRDSRWQPLENFPRDSVSALDGSWSNQSDAGANFIVCAGTSNIGIGCTQGGRTWNIYQQDLPTGDPAYSSSDAFPGTVRGVQAISVDASNPRRIYASFWDGMLYRSDNGGVRWRPAANGLPQDRAFIRHIVSKGNMALAVVGTELYGSLNGGEQWADLGRYSQPFWGQVHDAFLDATGGKVYAATDNGVYQTPAEPPWRWQRVVDLPDVRRIVRWVGTGDGLLLVAMGANQQSILYRWAPGSAASMVTSFARTISGIAADPQPASSVVAYVLLDSGEVVAIDGQGTRRSLGKRPAWPWDHTFDLLVVPSPSGAYPTLLLGHTNGLLQYTGSVDSSVSERSNSLKLISGLAPLFR